MTWSWQSHDWIWMQMNTATSKWTTSSTMPSQTVSVAAVTIFAPQVPAQSKSTRTGSTDALSDHGMLAWCTWPLHGSVLSPLSKILQIPRSTSLHSWHLNPAHNCFESLLSIPSCKKRSEGHHMVMTKSWLNLNATEYSDIKVDNIKPHAVTHSFSRRCHNLLHHRSPHKANQPGRVIRMHYQTTECLHDAVNHCLVQFFLHCLKF